MVWSLRTATTDITSAKGWPLEYYDIEPYYHEAANILGLLPLDELRNADVGILQDRSWNRLLSSGRLSIKKFQWNTPAFNTSTYLRAILPYYHNLNIILNCRMLSFCHPNVDGSVGSALFATKNGKRIKISGKIFVLAVGGIETPRLLLNSCGGQGLGNGSGLVGRFLSTHPERRFWHSCS